MSPLSNAFLREEQLDCFEKFFPLHVYVCSSCFLVQLPEFECPEHIFTDYAYFSSYSDTWLAHARKYVDLVTSRFGLGEHSLAVEVASNDGYLLQYLQARGIPVLGIEPAQNVAGAAIARGIPTLVRFFGASVARELVSEGIRADLLLGNNVLAHVPDLNDFVEGLRILLKPEGVITMEFPHLLRLMRENQFDTIYHEHFSYFSYTTVETVFGSHGLTLFDVEEIPTHGGSLRIYAKHAGDSNKEQTPRISELRAREYNAGLTNLESYCGFAEQVRECKRALLDFLIRAKRAGKRIVGYGAPAKGNTLLNYCGIRRDFVDYTVDISPHKQGLFLPGTHIPVYHPDRIRDTRPDYVLILPWNLKGEIERQMGYIREWGGRFVVPIPTVEVVA